MPKLNVDNKEEEMVDNIEPSDHFRMVDNIERPSVRQVGFIHNYRLVQIGNLGVGIQHINDAHPFVIYYGDNIPGDFQTSLPSSSGLLDLVDLFKFMNSEQVVSQLEELVETM